jgi:hypothetical protein
MSSISYSHKMALQFGLRLVEKHLRWIKGRLQEGGDIMEETILYRTRCDIKSSGRPKILKALEAMLEEIKLMKAEFGLETEEDTLGMHILGSLTEVWVAVEELRPEALKGYGRLAETSKRQIEPHVLKLLQSYDELSRALQDSREGGGREGRDGK